MIDLSPGPANCSTLWKQLMEDKLPYPLSDQFHELIFEAKTELSKFTFFDENIFFSSSSGTGSLECIIASLDPTNNILVIINGFFGQRLYDIATFHSLNTFKLVLDYEKSIDNDIIENLEILIRKHNIKVILFTHFETSYGLINKIDSLNYLKIKYHLIYIIDGVSALGGFEVNLSNTFFDAYISSAYKCLMCPPVLSFMMIRSTFFSVVRKDWSYYFNLRSHNEAFINNEFLWTPPTLSLFLFNKILKSIVNDNNYFIDIKIKSDYLRNSLNNMGFYTVGNNLHSYCFTTIKLKKINCEMIKRYLFVNGIVIGSGLGNHSQNYLRLGHYSYITKEEIDYFLNVLNMFIF